MSLDVSNDFEALLRNAIDPGRQLPSQLQLGKDVYIWENGNWKYKGERPGFRRLMLSELRQVMCRLQAAPQRQVVFLDLSSHRMGADMMRHIAAIIAELKGLQVLRLDSANPSPSPLPTLIYGACNSCSLR
jgi:hypothetical protein